MTKRNANIIMGVFTILITLVSLTAPVFADDVTVSRNMPSRVDPKGTLSTSFTITPAKALSGFDFAELIPSTWSIRDWSVSGYDKSSIALEMQDSQGFLGSTYKGYHWKFSKELSSSVVLTYNLDVPVSSGTYKFVGIYTYPGGFSKDESTLTVAIAPPTTTTTTLPLQTTTTAVEQPSKLRQLLPAIVTVAVIVILVVFIFSRRKIVSTGN